MALRKFHIDKFPQDRIFILLDKKFHIKLFKELHKKFPFEELNSLMNNKLNYSTYKKWRYRVKKRKNNINPSFIPLWFVIKVIKILPKFNIHSLEKEIIAYKGPSTSSIIWKPNLPLPEEGKLLKILSHLMGDGHVDGAFGTNLPKGKSHSEYKNNHEPLIKTFKEDLKVFGKIHSSERENGTYIIIPNIIGYILEHLYHIKFDTFNSRLPSEFYKLPKNLISKFIRAFFDDEGHVYDNHIEVYSANKFLLFGIMRLFQLKFPEIKISSLKINKNTKKNPKYYFYVLSESRKKYLELIGFDHLEKKEDLIFNIKRTSMKKFFKKGETKRLILDYLRKEKLTSRRLSRLILISHGTAINNLNQLEEKGLVEIVGKGRRNDNIWSLPKLNS